jgi:hypothetical protein
LILFMRSLPGSHAHGTALCVVVRLHCAASATARVCGFYLGRLKLRRRSTPSAERAKRNFKKNRQILTI